MATKFNTRIQLKYDTYENWTTNNPLLLSGEVAIVEIPTPQGSITQTPAVLLKVGNGKNNFNDLQWGSAIAADVYSWAKQENKPTYNASEIQGLEDFIAGEISDTNTTYQLVQINETSFKLQSKEVGSEEWQDVTTINITYTLKTGSTNGTVSFNNVEVPVAGLKSAAYEEASSFDPAGSAESAKTEANQYADSLISGLSAEAVTVSTGEIISSVSQANGIVSVSKKSLSAEDIPTIQQSQVSGLESALSGKQDTVVFNTTYNPETNKAATMTDVQNAVSGLSGAMHYVGNSTTDPAEGTVTIEGKPEYAPSSGDVVTYQSKEYVYDGSAWRELGDESSYAVKGSITDSDIAPDANISQSKIANLVSDLASKATPADITSAIEGLDYSDASVEGQFITSVSETDGIVSVERRALVDSDIPTIQQSKVSGLTEALGLKADISSLSAVATSGDISDLTQKEYVIFNCGSATTVM